jgi:hypothetical protein
VGNEANGLAVALSLAAGPLAVVGAKMAIASLVAAVIWHSGVVNRPGVVAGLSLVGCVGAIANLTTILSVVTDW